MPGPLDFKKESKNLYQPKTIPVIVDVPKMTFIMVDGKGTPMMNRGIRESNRNALRLSYTIKMSSKAAMPRRISSNMSFRHWKAYGGRRLIAPLTRAKGQIDLDSDDPAAGICNR